MSAHSFYDAMRHFADSWGLVVMVLLFAAFCVWPFRPKSRDDNMAAARMIFQDDDNG